MTDDTKPSRSTDIAALQLVSGALGLAAAAWVRFGFAAGLATFSVFLVGVGVRGLRA